MRSILFSTCLAAAVLAGCASPKVAQMKTVEVAGRTRVRRRLRPTRQQLSLTVNGDPVMSGSFPPFTPTQNLSARYRGLPIRAECYFGSVLSGKSGVVGIVAGAVQSANERAGDKCDTLVNDRLVESLYF